MSYNTKNFTEQGGEKTVIGGTLEIKEGAVVTGLPVLDNQAASTAAYKEVYEKVSALCPYVAINGLSYYDLYNKKIKNLDTAALYDFVKALDKATIE